ncbi:MAG: UpxY family transcription antiterminator [Deltaproteobacteria bacterium]|nr:UpxY family transcription antiterminator [Deltaproteobacteria bacterium]
MTDQLIRAWYVLHTRSRFENVVNEGLIKKTHEVFLPKILVRSKRRDRKAMIRVPLFPGYLFVRTDLNPYEHLDILKTVGAVRLIGSMEGPVSVADDKIDSLRIMVGTDQPVATGQRFKSGDHVAVVNGPFAGVTGIFVRYKGSGRVIVNIDALGQSAGVDVDQDDVEILPEIS